MVFGLVAQPWKLRSETVPLRGGQDFARFDDPGYLKAAVSFTFVAFGDATLVETETRTLATDARSRRRFRVYWTFVRPGSGLVRRSMLAAIKRRAEASDAAAITRGAARDCGDVRL